MPGFGWAPVSFQPLGCAFPPPLASSVFEESSDVKLTNTCIRLLFLEAFKKLSAFHILTMMYLGEDLFVFIQPESCWALMCRLEFVTNFGEFPTIISLTIFLSPPFHHAYAGVLMVFPRFFEGLHFPHVFLSVLQIA